MKLNYVLGLGIVLSLVCVSLLIAFGFLYLKPYRNVSRGALHHGADERRRGTRRVLRMHDGW